MKFFPLPLTKVGDNDKTTGYLIMNDVRIPRRHMMEKKAHVEPDGTYVLHKGKKNKTAGDGASGGNSDNSKLQYLSMMKTRVALVRTAAGSLARASVIAVRFSCVREQGFVDSKAEQSHLAQENQIIDYQNQLYRCAKWTATAYAYKFVARWLGGIKGLIDGLSAEELKGFHISSSGLKGVCTLQASNGIEDLRKACGGHGYLMNSGIASLEGDYKYNATAEGDYTVLLLQTGRYLYSARASARAGKPMGGIVSGLAPLQDAHFNAVRDGKPRAPAGGTLSAETYATDLE